MNVLIHASVVAVTTFVTKRFECTATIYVGNAGITIHVICCDLL